MGERNCQEYSWQKGEWPTKDAQQEVANGICSGITFADGAM